MSKTNKFRKRLIAFANQLTLGQAREQLVLSLLQMERCRQVLKGVNVEPLDTGILCGCSDLRIDLELFYNCKKVREELSLLSKEMQETEELSVHIDTSSLIQSLRAVRMEVCGLSADLSNLLKFLEDE